jgi:hypothetical protein
MAPLNAFSADDWKDTLQADLDMSTWPSDFIAQLDVQEEVTMSPSTSP